MKISNIKTIVFLVGILIFAACKPTKHAKEITTEETVVEKNAVKEKNPLTINITNPKEIKKIGDLVKISILLDKATSNDTVHLFINDTKVSTLTQGKMDFEFDTKTSKVGRNIISAKITRNGNTHKVGQSFTLLSDIVPEKYTYKVLKVYPHDIEAYTQGLFFLDGFLYEATGLKGESTIRKVKIETGEVLQGHAIPNDVFGEGICLFNDKIIQVSWQAGRGFVYSKTDFKIESEFSYGTEGWGITTDNKILYMSDGTANIYIIDPQTYSVTSTLQIYDNQGPVNKLNELEYIDGEIYANLYTTNKIAKIDPKTGKVTAYIDLTHLLPMNDYQPNTDVLNGIAYDKTGKRLFVTGKKWPKLFQVEFVKK